MKRALKALVNTDFAQANWSNLVGPTRDVIDKRYIKDPGDDSDSVAFYSMMCSQVMQKLLRTATQKFKTKDIVV